MAKKVKAAIVINIYKQFHAYPLHIIVFQEFLPIPDTGTDSIFSSSHVTFVIV